MLVDVDVSKLSGKTKRVNITLPERIFSVVDLTASRMGETRSGLLAKAALENVERHRAACKSSDACEQNGECPGP